MGKPTLPPSEQAASRETPLLPEFGEKVWSQSIESCRESH